MKTLIEILEEIWHNNPSWFATKQAVLKAIKELEKLEKQENRNKYKGFEYSFGYSNAIYDAIELIGKAETKAQSMQKQAYPLAEPKRKELPVETNSHEVVVPSPEKDKTKTYAKPTKLVDGVDE